MGNQFKLLKTLVKQGKVGVLCIHTISTKKHDIWLEGCCFLARCHAFLPLYIVCVTGERVNFIAAFH